MPRVINRADGFSIGRGLPIPQASMRKSNPPQQKSECQKNPDSLGCLEEQLSNLRSNTPLTVRRTSGIPVDPQLSFGGGGQYLNVIGGQTHALEQQIIKKKWSWA